MPRLSTQEIEKALSTLHNWKYENGELVKEFKFKDFASSIRFLTMVQPVADSLDHHPDLCVYYNRVVIHLTTHDEGGVTDLDLKLAQKLDELEKLMH
ncbi:putative pterin-4-alpha-carbinolamine dehydratase [Metallosphaera sp. J1]|uniref:4a-hydroxytetrahydrobiopterin dehydratase n=1 Tax=Metallosphaera TaxID=41980 RepID=UPI001EDE67AB|nr:4a-hydroxytetrahydrobiopterin dehydratase [Metallosphaera javensis (ex Hofmann et al. 2022)]MCG3108466.1 putative pterin-4-alpha-carbinolamine dehydratase [Metallosphaera javensis (ex Hofmann et al. 2022)]BCS92858.1 MAG: putative pterin-4-alpha-carbinolamine dehydratase [Metallosphaera javensis (ex Sakai et al. 2022)]